MNLFKKQLRPANSIVHFDTKRYLTGIRRVQKRKVSKRNISATWATLGFTEFYAHPEETNRAKYPVLSYTYLFMTILLIGVFSFFFTHTILWAFRALKERTRQRKEK